MKCPKCGKEIANDSLFCEYCGKKIHNKVSRKSFWGLLAVTTIMLAFCAVIIIDNLFEEKVGRYDEEQVVTHHSVTLYGAVDKYPITMSLNFDGSLVKGTYYYNKQGPDKVLTLSGVMNGSEMDIYESDENGRQTGHFKGHYSNGEYQGEFITMQGKSMYFHVTE